MKWFNKLFPKYRIVEQKRVNSIEEDRETVRRANRPAYILQTRVLLFGWVTFKTFYSYSEAEAAWIRQHDRLQRKVIKKLP